MPCCGQKRDTLKTDLPSRVNDSALPGSWTDSRPRSASSQPLPAPPARPHTVALQYTEASHIVVEGSLTKRRYEFSAAQAVQMVDAGDAAILLATRFFVRV